MQKAMTDLDKDISKINKPMIVIGWVMIICGAVSILVGTLGSVALKFGSYLFTMVMHFAPTESEGVSTLSNHIIEVSKIIIKTIIF